MNVSFRLPLPSSFRQAVFLRPAVVPSCLRFLGFVATLRVPFGLPTSGGLRYAAALLILVLPALGHTQVIQNPGFENDLTDWASRSKGGMNAAKAEAARTGDLGLRFTDDSPDKGTELESLAVQAEPGKKYEVSFWVRTVSGDGGVRAALHFFNESGARLQKKPPSVITVPSAEWDQFSVTATAPEGAVAFNVFIQTVTGSVSVSDVDDFEVKEVP